MKRYLYLFHIVLAYAVMAISTDSYARTVKGKVVSGEEALSKVIVTDGHHFTQTRKDGSFKMKIADTTKFVYVISPSAMPEIGRMVLQSSISRLKERIISHSIS